MTRLWLLAGREGSHVLADVVVHEELFGGHQRTALRLVPRVSFEFPADEQRRRAQALVGPASAMWATMVAGD